MIHQQKTLPCLFIFIILFSVVIIPIGKSCKDIVITPPATAGNYSLLLKVRDPSRPGLQVLCRVPEGTQYTYHHPWTGKPWEFIVTHTFFGVATQGDTLPNIVKAGMVLTDAGLAFGDADTLSNWKNPTRNAWDDFDWIRYACQTADNEDEAIKLLTTEVIDQLHATGVSENLFLVGPQRAVVIEADAVHHTIKDVTDILVMSNYPKDLWGTQLVKSLPIASSFDIEKETWVRHGSIIHLESICGVKIIQTNQFSITVQAVPRFVFHSYGLNKEVTIYLGERATVGPYSVKLLDINGNTAKIMVCTAVHAWEKELQAHIRPMSGSISVKNMISYSRLHATDLDGLRPLCEDTAIYEAAMIYKIPNEHANLLSSGWFAANHPCSSIYVPVHICDNDFYDPYQTGEAAALSLELLHLYGHGALTSLCQNVENVFLSENEENEILAHQMIHNASDITPFLTALDRGMQEQAFLTEQLWLGAPNASRGIIENIWMGNYTLSLQRMQQTVSVLKNISGTGASISTIGKIALSICKSRIETAAIQGRNCTEYEQEYTAADQYFKSGEYTIGFAILQHFPHI
ncbi:MAG: hypothetical protein NTZ75_03790 [Euryarchaeota archaeon]|nr:hypothetical protein [Euryarchaeota archaeon]